LSGKAQALTFKRNFRLRLSPFPNDTTSLKPVQLPLYQYIRLDAHLLSERSSQVVGSVNHGPEVIMAMKSDRSFPCLLWLSERFSEQSHEIQERPESDYVFFSPAVGRKQRDARSLNLEGRIGAHPEGQSGLSEDNSGVLSGDRLDRRF
jgi:hypothetical protein